MHVARRSVAAIQNPIPYTAANRRIRCSRTIAGPTPDRRRNSADAVGSPPAIVFKRPPAELVAPPTIVFQFPPIEFPAPPAIVDPVPMPVGPVIQLSVPPTIVDK